MSKFYTPFPFPVEEMKQLLPAGSYLEAVKWNKEKNQVEIHWEHDPYFTGRDFPIEFGPLALKNGIVPKEVTERNHGTASASEPDAGEGDQGEGEEDSQELVPPGSSVPPGERVPPASSEAKVPGSPDRGGQKRSRPPRGTQS